MGNICMITNLLKIFYSIEWNLTNWQDSLKLILNKESRTILDHTCIQLSLEHSQKWWAHRITDFQERTHQRECQESESSFKTQHFHVTFATLWQRMPPQSFGKCGQIGARIATAKLTWRPEDDRLPLSVPCSTRVRFSLHIQHRRAE